MKGILKRQYCSYSDEVCTGFTLYIKVDNNKNMGGGNNLSSRM